LENRGVQEKADLEKLSRSLSVEVELAPHVIHSSTGEYSAWHIYLPVFFIGVNRKHKSA
jgi:hypothetical protein